MGGKSLLTGSGLGNNVEMWGNDDGSGRQQFEFTKVPGEQNTYTVRIPRGMSA